MDKSFYKKNQDDIETILLFDYKKKFLKIYTTRNASIRKFYKKLGDPSRTDYVNEKIYSCDWIIQFEDRNHIKKTLNLPNFLL